VADGTHIEWTDATANVINGCSLLSPGCTNCYAMRLAGTRMKHHPTREGLTIDTKAGPVWNGTVRFNEKALQDVLHWSKPRMIFWNAHGDLFHDSVPDEWIDRCFAVMALTPQHKHQVLTKRSARMREYMNESCGRIADAVMAMRKKLGIKSVLAPLPHVAPGAIWWPLSNVWLGVSVEDQTRADERIPDLLATPAAVRWISAEPLLGPVDLNRIHEEFDGGLGHSWESALDGKRFSIWAGDDEDPMVPGHPKLDWVVVGGESGPNARPMDIQWARSLRDQCQAAGTGFLFKQFGEWVPAGHEADQGRSDWPAHRWNDGAVSFRVGKKQAGRLLDGVEHDGYPA